MAYILSSDQVKQMHKFIILIFTAGILNSGCSASQSYVEKWSGVNLSNDLRDVSIFDEGFTETYIVVHGVYAKENYKEFVTNHGLEINRSDVDYIKRKFGNYANKIDSQYLVSTSPKNIFARIINHQNDNVTVEIFLDSGNSSIWIVIATG